MAKAKLRRRVPIENGLHFDYEVSPHRAFLAKIAAPTKGAFAGVTVSQTPPPTTTNPVPATGEIRQVGDYVPFKQSRLEGQINPLRLPLHVEAVLIGRALGQPTGYLFGVGFRVRDDGYVEAEFADGVRKFDSYEKFRVEVAALIRRNESA
jgi:hypothetical protein